MPRLGSGVERSHPSFQVMLLEGVSALHRKKGVSGAALAQYVEETYDVHEGMRARHMRVALRKMEEDGLVRKEKASYHLTEVGRFKRDQARHRQAYALEKAKALAEGKPVPKRTLFGRKKAEKKEGEKKKVAKKAAKKPAKKEKKAKKKPTGGKKAPAQKAASKAKKKGAAAKAKAKAMQ